MSGIVGENADWDLICLKVNIPKEKIHPLSISEILPEVGEKIVVIGCPMGFSGSVSEGIVSGLRNNNSHGKIIQMTASISKGSSGSPVVSMNGNVIAIATFLQNDGQNLNFAIPGKRIAELTSGKKRSI